MNNKLVSLAIAKLAKEKGFTFEFKNEDNYDYGFHSYFERNSNKLIVAKAHWYADTNQNIQQYNDLQIDAPTQALLQKWLREIHSIIVEVNLYTLGHYQAQVINIYGATHIIKNTDNSPLLFSTYEEALEVGLLAGLNLIS